MRKPTFFVVVAAAIVLDQATKFLIKSNMTLGESIPADWPVRLTYTTNRAGAFGLFANQSFLLALTAAIGIFILLFYLRSLRVRSKVLSAGLALDLGGAAGNLIDRVRLGEVTDFIDVGFWPVFNLADSAITVGTILIAYYLLFGSGQKAPQPSENRMKGPTP